MHAFFKLDGDTDCGERADAILTSVHSSDFSVRAVTKKTGQLQNNMRALSAFLGILILSLVDGKSVSQEGSISGLKIDL